MVFKYFPSFYRDLNVVECAFKFMYNLDSSMLKFYHEYVFLQICDKASDKIRSPLLRPRLLGNLQFVQSLLPKCVDF